MMAGTTLPSEMLPSDGEVRHQTLDLKGCIM
jgi:hypothetical protein